MKKLLIASTALSLAGGAAFAEMAITVSGDAEMGVDYNSEPGEGMSKHTFAHEVGIDFTASGTTDGGLTFGGSAGFNSGGDSIDEGTVHVSGSFGTLTIGDNDSADVTAGGIADIGLNGIGVDDMTVEGLRGGTANQLRYDNSFGQISIAISAGTATVGGEVITPMVPAVEEVSTPAVPPSEWRVIGPNGTIHSYPENYSVAADGTVKLKDHNKPMLTGTAITNLAFVTDDDAENDYKQDEFDKIFGVVARVAADANTAPVGIFVDHDGKATTAAINIVGYGQGEDGKLYRNPTTAEIDADNGITAASRVEVVDNEANASAIAAFEKYAAGHNLGKDNRVGGLNTGTGDNEVVNVDTLKVTTNEMKKMVTTEAVAAIPAVLSPIKSETQYAFGMNFDAGGVTIGVGYDSNKTVSMGAGFSAGEVSTNLLYVKTDDDTTGIGADMTYTMGASAVTLAYGRKKLDDGEATDAVGMGVTHDLGGGATMNAGFGKVGESNKASIGLMFTF